MMMISIIIPCHDTASYISKCLNSIIQQENNLNIQREIIVVCDSCSDNSQQIATEILSKQNSWSYKIISVNEKSPGGARNKGYELAIGKYIWFVDSDDWIPKINTIDTLINIMEKENLNLINFKIQSNADPNGNYGSLASTVWQSIETQELIGDTVFNDRQNGEDNDWAYEIWHKSDIHYKQIDFIGYFYNFPRRGSQSDLKHHFFK